MPYKKSDARKTFEETFSELLALSREISYKKVSLSYDHKNLIFQSSVILLCSALEQYLKEFTENLFFRYRNCGATLTEIPVNSRTYALFHKQRTIYENFVYQRNEMTILEKLDVSDTTSYSILDGSNPFTNQINSNIIFNDKKYPSPKNLKILYNRLGIKNIFNDTNRIGGKNYEILIRAFLDTRETIAHHESTDLTFEDVKRNFNNIGDLLDKLDRTSYHFICKNSGQKYWD